jgi:hypothetical protein
VEINIKACEIEFELDTSVNIAVGGGRADVVSVLFKKPNMVKAPFFENLCSMFHRAMTKNILMMQELATDDQLEEAEAINNKKLEAEANIPAIKSLENITVEDIEEEVEGFLGMLTTMDFDYERGYKLLFKILISNDKRYTPCLIGGQKATEQILEQLDYQDAKRMLVTYISFFGKPAKSGTPKDSELHSGSDVQVTDVSD